MSAKAQTLVATFRDGERRKRKTSAKYTHAWRARYTAHLFEDPVKCECFGWSISHAGALSAARRQVRLFKQHEFEITDSIQVQS